MSQSVDIWSFPKHPWRHLVYAKGPRYSVLSKMSVLRKCPQMQIAHNVYFYFWFTELICKNAIMFYWSNNCITAILPIVTLLALVAQLVIAQGVRQMGHGLNVAEEQGLYSLCSPNISMDIFRHGQISCQGKGQLEIQILEMRLVLQTMQELRASQYKGVGNK